MTLGRTAGPSGRAWKLGGSREIGISKKSMAPTGGVVSSLLSFIVNLVMEQLSALWCHVINLIFPFSCGEKSVSLISHALLLATLSSEHSSTNLLWTNPPVFLIFFFITYLYWIGFQMMPTVSAYYIQLRVDWWNGYFQKHLYYLLPSFITLDLFLLKHTGSIYSNSSPRGRRIWAVNHHKGIFQSIFSIAHLQECEKYGACKTTCR